MDNGGCTKDVGTTGGMVGGGTTGGGTGGGMKPGGGCEGLKLARRKGGGGIGLNPGGGTGIETGNAGGTKLTAGTAGATGICNIATGGGKTSAWVVTTVSFSTGVGL